MLLPLSPQIHLSEFRRADSGEVHLVKPALKAAAPPRHSSLERSSRGTSKTAVDTAPYSTTPDFGAVGDGDVGRVSTTSAAHQSPSQRPEKSLGDEAQVMEQERIRKERVRREAMDGEFLFEYEDDDEGDRLGGDEEAGGCGSEISKEGCSVEDGRCCYSAAEACRESIDGDDKEEIDIIEL